MQAGKIWGSTRRIVSRSDFDAHWLEIKPNAQCSLHCHKYKRNGFIVFSGRLTIEVHKSSYDLVDATVLGPGDYTEVAPNEYHRFISGDEPVVAIEWYLPEPLSEDIIRKDCGSLLLK